MQDNKFHPDLDSAFEDKAWQDMYRQLDEEMPVPKEKRRFIFWWWLGSAVAVLILSTSLIFIYSYKESSKEQVAPPNKEVINSKILDQHQAIIKNRPTQEASNQQAILNNTTISKPIKEPIKQTPKDNQKKSRKTEKKSLLPIVNFNNSPVKQDTDHFANPITNPPTLVTITYAEQVATPFSSTLDDNFTVNRAPLPLKELPILTKKGISPLLIPIVALNTTSPIILPIRDTTNWQWGLQATLGTFKFNRFNEYSIGILASRQLSPKWRLQTGITYEYLRLNSLNTAITDDALLSDQANSEADCASGNGGGFLGTTLDAFQDPNVKILKEKGRIHYLNVPVLLAYQLGPNFNINGGANLSYAFKDSYGALDGDALRLRRWDISAMLGGTYKVSSKLDLQLQYSVGLFEKRKAFNLGENNFSSADVRYKKYSPLEGRIRFSGIWWF